MKTKKGYPMKEFIKDLQKELDDAEKNGMKDVRIRFGIGYTVGYCDYLSICQVEEDGIICIDVG